MKTKDNDDCMEPNMNGSGFYTLPNHFAAKYGKIVGPSAWLVYTVMRGYADHNGEGCFASMTRLARETGLSRRYVITLVAKLIEHGLITRTDHHHGRKTTYLMVDPNTLPDPQTGEAQFTTQLVHCSSPVKHSSPPLVKYSSPELVNCSSPEQEPVNKNQLTRTSKASTTGSRRKACPKPRRWPYEEPLNNAIMHVVWAAEQRAGTLLVTSDLDVELRHVSTMLNDGFTEDEIVECWHDAIKFRPAFASPRFIVGKIGAWRANKVKYGGHAASKYARTRTITMSRHDGLYSVEQGFNPQTRDWEDIRDLGAVDY